MLYSGVVGRSRKVAISDKIPNYLRREQELTRIIRTGSKRSCAKQRFKQIETYLNRD